MTAARPVSSVNKISALPRRREKASGLTLGTSYKDKPMMIHLTKLHRAVHQVSGSMALKFNRATVADLRHWAEALQAVADEMKVAADCRYTSAAPVSDDALEHKRRDDASHDDRE